MPDDMRTPHAINDVRWHGTPNWEQCTPQASPATAPSVLESRGEPPSRNGADG